MKNIITVIFSIVLFVSAHAQMQVDTFFYTGASQILTIGTCGTSVTFDVRGGKGGDQSGALGGFGGRVQGTVTLSVGDVLEINVGQAGLDDQGSSAGVFVGSGAVHSYSSGGVAGTGGGASDIRLNGSALNDRIVVGGVGNAGQALTGGGGGGSSYADPLAVSVVHSQGFQNGDGMVILSYLSGPNQTVIACDSFVSPSGNYTWYTSGIYNYTIAAVVGCTDTNLVLDVTITNSF